MPVRHALLATAAVLVLGMGVYLFLEVRKPPVQVASNAKPVTEERDDSSPDERHDGPVHAGKRVSGAPGLRPATTRDAVAATPNAAPPATSDEPAPEGKLEGPKLDAVMAEANKAYDKADFEEARAIAQKVLKVAPTNVRMLRIMTSAHCIEADTAEAQKYFNQLPGPDREQMKTRCARYGVTFTDPPAR